MDRAWIFLRICDFEGSVFGVTVTRTQEGGW